MHPRNRYRDHPPRFALLAESHPALAKYLAPPDYVLSASEPGAIETLVAALLRVDFNISSYDGVPAGYLVPSVTRSLNYLHLVEDLLVEAQTKQVIVGGAKRRGLDVGVGASCVFPLLGCALHADWEFVGVDVNPQALDSAKSNSACFGERIRLVHSDLLANVLFAEEARFDFVLCNPPFFSTPACSSRDRPFGGTELERSCEGGEVAFVSRLIAQSAVHAKRVVWFSSMLGIKESLREVLTVLHHHQPLVSTIRVHRLEQGHTFRWAVFWSFYPELGVGVVLGQTIRVSNLASGEALERRIEEALRGLRHYSADTGVCGGPGYRFRLRVVVGDAESCRVDVLDVAGPVAAKAARSAQHRTEQDIARTSRKWRKKA